LEYLHAVPLQPCYATAAFACCLSVGRSTKGASKQRRDAINEHVGQIRELLPVSEAARSRLSQLQVMALARSYIAKSNLFTAVIRQSHIHILQPTFNGLCSQGRLTPHCGVTLKDDGT